MVRIRDAPCIQVFFPGISQHTQVDVLLIKAFDVFFESDALKVDFDPSKILNSGHQGHLKNFDGVVQKDRNPEAATYKSKN